MPDKSQKQRYTYHAGDKMTPAEALRAAGVQPGGDAMESRSAFGETEQEAARGSLYRQELTRQVQDDDSYAHDGAAAAPAPADRYDALYGIAPERERYSEPAHEEPAYSGPAYEEPLYNGQAYDGPAYNEPMYNGPAYDEPVYDEPVYSGPVYNEPVYNEPVYNAPAYNEPEYEEPGYGEPAYSPVSYTEPEYFAAADEFAVADGMAGTGFDGGFDGTYDDYGPLIQRRPSRQSAGYAAQATAEYPVQAAPRPTPMATEAQRGRVAAGAPRRSSSSGRPAQGGRRPSSGRVAAKGRSRAKSHAYYGEQATRTGAYKALTYLARTLTVVLVVVVALVGLAFGAITVICKGPFPTAREMFVVSVTETSAVKWLANIYFSKDEVAAIIAANTVLPPEETTDTTTPFVPEADEQTKKDIEIEDVKGSTFVGKMMIVHDPTRVRLATLDAFGAGVEGKKVEDFAAENNAVAAINGGGFADLNGMGLGGQPLGVVIKNGAIMAGGAGTSCNMIGFTAEGQLIVGVMTGQEALDKGMQEGISFDPTLIVNGTPAEISGNGGGPNPRTVIGQREDGAVLMLVIDGRQPHSLGATLQDCMQVMLDYGAVNASNLDGGSSSMMIYEGETINTPASLYGSRGQPACWIVV